jgi:hypothetical protein
MAHALIRGLPPDDRQQLDVMLVQGKPMGEVVAHLRGKGLLPQLSEPSLRRALRRYRLDTVSIPEAARVKAMEKAPPRLRARIAEQTSAHEQLAKMKNIATSRDKAFWAAVEKTPVGLAAMSETLRKSAESAFAMHERVTRLAMDAGIIPRAAQQVHITAEMVVVRDERDASALIEALIAYVGRTREIRRDHGLLEEQIGSVQQLLNPPERVEPEPLSENALHVLADMRRLMAEAKAERVAKITAPAAVPVEDDGPAVFIDDDDQIEIVPLGVPLPRARGVLIEHDADDGMPALEQVW